MAPFDGSLPHGFGDPLHLLEPARPWPWSGPLILLLLLLAWWALRRLRRARPSAPATAPEPPPADAPAGDFLDILIAARRRHGRAGTFREGCHELAAILRSFFARRSPIRSGPPYDRLTMREIGARLGDPFTTSLLELLEELRFGRRRPREDDLRGVYELAAEVVMRSANASAAPPATASPEKVP